jgi:hypothetical protein
MSDRKGKSSGDREFVGYCQLPKSGQFVKGRSGNPRGRPRQLKKLATGSFGDNEFDVMFHEEMKRQVTVREGESLEKISVERAATRAIALKAAKGDVKAYRAVIDKRGAIDKRKEAQWEEQLEIVVTYKNKATLELRRQKEEQSSEPEIVPHPDDIEIDFERRVINFNRPITLEQKMAQDLLVATWPARDRQWRELSLSIAEDPWCLRQYSKSNSEIDKLFRLVAKRASTVNSWERATLEERKDYLRRYFWPNLSKKLPPQLARSELYFISSLEPWFGIELTKEQNRELTKELRNFFRDASPTLKLSANI